MLPGFSRTQCAPASSALSASVWLKWMSAITGIGDSRDDRAQRLDVLVARHGDADDVGAGLGDAADLGHRGGQVGGLGLGHRLHGDRRAAADRARRRRGSGAQRACSLSVERALTYGDSRSAGPAGPAGPRGPSPAGPSGASGPSPSPRRRRMAIAPNVTAARISTTRMTITGVGRNEPPDPPPPPPVRLRLASRLLDHVVAGGVLLDVGRHHPERLMELGGRVVVVQRAGGLTVVDDRIAAGRCGQRRPGAQERDAGGGTGHRRQAEPASHAGKTNRNFAG